jgi:hypothetical protein
MLLSDELEMLAYLNILLQNMPGGTEVNTRNLRTAGIPVEIEHETYDIRSNTDCGCRSFKTGSN